MAAVSSHEVFKRCCTRTPSELPLVVQRIHDAPREQEMVTRRSPATHSLLLPLRCVDRLWLELPMRTNAYRAYSFVLRDCPPSLDRTLKLGLSKCLEHSPSFSFLSGRYDCEARGIIDSNEGIPFTTAGVAHALDDELAASEDLLYRLADLRLPGDVKAHRAPLMTISLCTFARGAAVLTVSASHAVLDGEALMAFVACWAAYTREGAAHEAFAPALVHRLGRAPAAAASVADSPCKSWLIAQLFALSTREFLGTLGQLPRSARCPLSRPCVEISGAVLRRVKAAAAPVPPAWVSTQEALAAQVMLLMWSQIADPAKECARCSFWLGGRKYVGDSADPAANYLYVQDVTVPAATLREGLKAVALCLHDGLQQVNAAEMESKAAKVEATGVKLAPIVELFSSLKDPPTCAFHFKLNNLSKIPLPTFGASGQAVSTHALAMGGPTGLLASPDGGVRMFLQKESLPSKMTAEELASLMRQSDDFKAA
ncbi:hypothetical protein AB1Y20_001605 [Prymnesium parvum]|uniref:Uncharacterized protein n=1 Tax=Prymnesium parvum TaxID=97485 RepID=A0AB34K8S4_PRYPA